MTLKELRELERMRRNDRSKAFSVKKRGRTAAPEAVSLCLERLFAKTPDARRKMLESRALLLWPELVGEPVSTYSEALRVRDGTLLVRVPDALWMQQLCLLKSDLLLLYREKLPTLGLRDIFFTRR